MDRLCLAVIHIIQACSTLPVSPDKQKGKRLLNFKKRRKKNREGVVAVFLFLALDCLFSSLFVRPDKLRAYRIKKLVKIVTNTLCNVIICVLIHHSLHYLTRFGDS